MGIPKQSRKGKKAWRKNIDATEIETFFEDEGHKQQREPAVDTLKDEELFVVDKAADDSAVPAAVRKRRREPKPLRSQLILDSLRDGVTPVPQDTQRKPKGSGKLLPNSTAAAAQQQQQQQQQVVPSKKRQRRQRGGTTLTDIWAEDATAAAQQEQDWTRHKSGNELERLAKLKQQQEAAAAAATAAAAAASRRSSRKRPAAAPISAVEIDMPGCSFNPEYEAHQDALAVAVAAEYKKQLKQELAPRAPSQFAPAGFKLGDELDELLGDAEADEQPDDEQQQQQKLALAAAAAAATKDENAIAIDDEDDEGEDAEAAADGGEAATADVVQFTPGRSTAAAAGPASEKKTRRERNKEARRKQQEAEAEAKRHLKRQRQQLEALPQLQQQLEQEEQQKELMRTRREVVKQEKAAIQPPRLGKHKFEAAAPEVLTSDQVTGSLRQLQPCFLVTADRFKALQKRGLIEPRQPAGKKQGKKVEYVTGERREKAEERQKEVHALAAARKKAAKGGAAGAAALAGLAGKGAAAGKKRGKREGGAAAQQAAERGLVMPLAVGGAADGGW